MLHLLCLLLTLTFPIVRSCLVILAFSYHVLNIECIQCIEHQKYAHLQTEQLIVQTLLFLILQNCRKDYLKQNKDFASL